MKGALIFGLMGVFVLVGLGLYAFISRSIIEPLEAFTKTVKGVNPANLSARVKIRREDEIGVLAASFNKMAENLEVSHRALHESEERYRLLIQNVPVGLFIRVDALPGKAKTKNGIIEKKVRMIYVTFCFEPYSFLKYCGFTLAFILTCSLFVGAVLGDKFQLTLNSFVPYKRSLFAININAAT